MVAADLAATASRKHHRQRSSHSDGCRVDIKPAVFSVR